MNEEAWRQSKETGTEYVRSWGIENFYKVQGMSTKCVVASAYDEGVGVTELIKKGVSEFTLQLFGGIQKTTKKEETTIMTLFFLNLLRLLHQCCIPFPFVESALESSRLLSVSMLFVLM